MAKQPFENVVQHLFQIVARAEFKTLTDQELLNRYVEHQDELAFGELVCRYKAMVWYVCWRVLRNQHDVEDAFQATIMTLVRKAKTIQNRETIEGWMHRTAFTVASNAKVARVRRREREERSATMRKEDYRSHESQWELSEVLDKELLRIPEKYRSPMLLCYLDGLTWNEAAQRLGISLNSLKWRLEEGRAQLKKRLSKYGMEWSPTMLVTGMTPGIYVPEVSPALVEKTLDMVRILILLNGVLETVGISAEVATLVKGAMGMTMKMKMLLGSLVLSLVVVGAGAAKYSGVLQLLLRGQQQEGKREAANKGPTEPKEDKSLKLKDLYGDPLPEHALARMGTIRLWNGKVGIGEIGDGMSLIFSPDGKILASHRDGNLVYLWNTAMGKVIRWLTTNSGDKQEKHLVSMVFSADSQRLVTVHRDQIRLWEVATGKLLRVYQAPEKKNAYLCGVTFLPNGMILVAQDYLITRLPKWSQLKGIQVWEATTGKVIPMGGHIKGIRIYVAFSQDGKTLATKGGIENPIQLWDIATGKEIRQLTASGKFRRTMAFSPDGKTFASGDREKNKIDVWEVTTGKKLYQLDCGHVGFLSFPLAYSPDGAILAGGGREPGRPGHLWSVATGKEIRTFNWINTKVVTFSPNGKIIATGDDAGVIRWWEVANGKEIGPRTGYRSGIQSIAYSSDGKTLLSGSQDQDQAIRSWVVTTGKEIRQKTHRAWGNDKVLYWGYSKILAYSPDSKTLATMYDNQLSLLEESTGKMICQIPQQRHHLHFVVFSPDGKLLATSHKNRIVRVYEIATGKEVYRLPTRGQILNEQFWMVAFSPNGGTLAGPGKEEGTVCLWEMTTGKVIGYLGKAHQREPGKWPDEFCIRTLAFSPDGRMIVGAGRSGDSARLWEVATGKEIYSLNKPKRDERYNKWASLFTFSPDGRMLAAAGGEDRTVYLWEVLTGKEICQLSGHQGRVNAVAFSPDGKTLASCSDDVTCLIWDVTSLSRQKPAPAWAISQRALSQEQLETAWSELAHLESAKAYSALNILRAAPRQAIPWLQAHIPPVAPLSKPQQQLLRQWIADLDHDRFELRAKAQQEIEKLGELAISALRQAVAERPPLEARRRLQYLLAQLEPKHPRRLREMRAVQILESMGTPEAQQVLRAWAQGAAEASLTRDAQAALARLRKRLVANS